jgi:hypothetical protein
MTLCFASQRVFIVVSVHFVIDSVRKLLVTPSYFDWRNENDREVQWKSDNLLYVSWFI